MITQHLTQLKDDPLKNKIGLLFQICQVEVSLMILLVLDKLGKEGQTQNITWIKTIDSLMTIRKFMKIMAK